MKNYGRKTNKQHQRRKGNKKTQQGYDAPVADKNKKPSTGAWMHKIAWMNKLIPVPERTVPSFALLRGKESPISLLSVKESSVEPDVKCEHVLVDKVSVLAAWAHRNALSASCNENKNMIPLVIFTNYVTPEDAVSVLYDNADVDDEDALPPATIAVLEHFFDGMESDYDTHDEDEDEDSSDSVAPSDYWPSSSSDLLDDEVTL
jgi:hypothetical protein